MEPRLTFVFVQGLMMLSKRDYSLGVYNLCFQQLWRHLAVVV